MDPYLLRVPVVTPRLASCWIRLVTRADEHIAESDERARAAAERRDAQFRGLGFARRAMAMSASTSAVSSRKSTSPTRFVHKGFRYCALAWAV